MKRKPGRPPKYDNEFYKMIVKEHETYSISKLAKYHKTSNATIIRWLARGRDINEQTESAQ